MHKSNGFNSASTVLYKNAIGLYARKQYNYFLVKCKYFPSKM